MISESDFPRLTPLNHRVTSPAALEYNCIAWSVGDTRRWWQPGVFWPVESLANDFGVGALIKAFESLGYEAAEGEAIEPGFEKVALYGSAQFYTHASRQLPDGRWTSKLGRAEDIEHDCPDAVAGGLYGEVVRIMKRSIDLA